MTAYIIAGSMYLILGIITFLVFRRNKRLELENDLLETDNKAKDEYIEKELKAIHALEDSISESAKIRREANEERKKAENSTLSERIDQYNSLSK